MENTKTFGFEIEFFVPDEQLLNYAGLFHNPDTDNFGLDSGNLNICEYRSNVSTSIAEEVAEYENFLTTIAPFNPVFCHWKDGNSYGIHLSFNMVNKIKVFFLFIKIFFFKHPLICISRMFTIDWFRQHANRIEFRLIPCLPDDKLFRKFLSNLT